MRAACLDVAGRPQTGQCLAAGPVLSPVSLSLVFSPQPAAVASQGCCVVVWEGRGDAGRGILRVPTTEQPGPRRLVPFSPSTRSVGKGTPRLGPFLPAGISEWPWSCLCRSLWCGHWGLTGRSSSCPLESPACLNLSVDSAEFKRK